MKQVEIKLVEPTTEKLRLVKLIKDCSGLGLKDSKDLLDNLHNYPNKAWEMPIRDWDTWDHRTGIKTPTTQNWHQKFIEELKDIPGKFIVTGGKEWQRDMKLMKLGMSEKSEIIRALSEYILNNWSDSPQILEEALMKLDESQLIEVVSKVKLESVIQKNKEDLPF